LKLVWPAEAMGALHMASARQGPEGALLRTRRLAAWSSGARAEQRVARRSP
jgi:hypothetical protein